MLRVPKPKGVAIWVVAGLMGMQASPAWAFSPAGDTGYGTPVDTAEPLSTVDGDGDNFSPAQGDCDDNDATAYPGNEEICADEVDNDCNGFYDDGCDGRAQFGTLRGGGGCTGGTGVGNTAFILLPILPLLLVTRRRS